MTERDLMDQLSKYGPVVSTRILRYMVTHQHHGVTIARGSSRGVGFAEMMSKEICETVIKALNGRYIEG